MVFSPADHCPKAFPAGGGAREIPDFFFAAKNVLSILLKKKHSLHSKIRFWQNFKRKLRVLSPADHCPKAFPAGGGAREIPDFPRRKIYCRFLFKKHSFHMQIRFWHNLMDNCGFSPADHCPKAFLAGGGAREIPDFSRRRMYCRFY